MFREFNVKFEDVEMLGGADNLLEGTEITKVIVRGDNNKMSSLDSMLKNCNELDTIEGELDLNGVSDIDNLLEGTELVKSINLKNINNENISANNSFPHVDQINIGGELYNKKAMQNVIASKDWTFDNITYQGTVGDNIVTKEVNIIDDNKVTIKDTLEQKAKGIEIVGQTYENLVVGSGEATLLDELTLESIDGSPNEFTPHIEQPVCVEVVEGNTVQDESNIYSIGELQEDGTYKIDILSIKPLAKINDFESGRLDRGVLGYASDSIIQIKDGNIECTTLIGWRGCTSGFAKVNPNTEYSFDYNIVPNGIEVMPCPHFYTKDKVYISDLYNKSTFTTPSNAEYVRIYFACGVVASFTIKDFDFSNKSTQSILLPQSLNKIGEIKDKFYWDDNKGHYCIEENAPKIDLHTMDWTYTHNDNLPEDEISFIVSNYCQNNNISVPSYNANLMRLTIKHNIPILDISINAVGEGDAFAYHGSGSVYFKTKKTNIVNDSPIPYLKEKDYFIIVTRPTPNIIDLPHLNKKYSLDTYMPTTYLECTNSPMQPSRILLESDTVRYKPTTLETDTDYTIQFECKEKSDKKVKLNLGGTEKEVDAEVGLNHVSITTPSEIDTSLYKDRLFLSGAGNKVADVIVNKGEMNQYPKYFNGVQSVGELQDDGTYKIDVETYSQTNNIFNPNQKYVDGKFINDNGVEQINAGYGYTIDFIKSNPNTRYVGQNTSCIYCYDDNKQFISRIPFWGNGTIVSSATPSNCYYVRFQLEWSKLPNKDLRLHKVAEGNSVIDIDDWKSFTISVTSNNPLAKGHKLYWNKSNKRYEIDRGGDIEVPNVSGDVIDLPRLYQREDTNFTIEGGNIKPSKTSINYLDIG